MRFPQFSFLPNEQVSRFPSKALTEVLLAAERSYSRMQFNALLSIVALAATASAAADVSLRSRKVLYIRIWTDVRQEFFKVDAR